MRSIPLRISHISSTVENSKIVINLILILNHVTTFFITSPLMFIWHWTTCQPIPYMVLINYQNHDLFDMINNGIRFTLLSNSSTLKQFPYTLVSQTFPMLRKINWSGWQGDIQLLVMAVIEVMHVLFTTHYCLHCQDISMSLQL